MSQTISQIIYISSMHVQRLHLAAYENVLAIANGVYTDSIVIHQVNFVDLNNTKVYTQNMENLWMRKGS